VVFRVSTYFVVDGVILLFVILIELLGLRILYFVLYKDFCCL
jgi:hypothetical protein